MDEFKDKVVLITGAGRGIGRATAEKFAAHGAVVAANDITPINLDETLERIAAAGGTAHAYIFDIAKRIPVQTMIEQVVEELGRVDILVNNAGVMPKGAILDMDDWDWQRTLDVNLSGAFYTIQQVGRTMRNQGGGVIVNVGDTLSNPGLGEKSAAYLTSKAGMLELTRAAARELAPYNVRVNAVCPEGIPTFRPGVPEGSGSQAALSGRAGAVEDAANLILFLCSSASAHLVGQVIALDGGRGLAGVG